MGLVYEVDNLRGDFMLQVEVVSAEVVHHDVSGVVHVSLDVEINKEKVHVYVWREMDGTWCLPADSGFNEMSVNVAFKYFANCDADADPAAEMLTEEKLGKIPAFEHQMIAAATACKATFDALNAGRTKFITPYNTGERGVDSEFVRSFRAWLDGVRGEEVVSD